MIKYRFDQIESLQKAFDPKIVEKATNSAVTKTTRKARTKISKDVRATYRFKAKEISKSVKIQKQVSRNGIAGRVLLYSGVRTSLVNLRSGSPKRVKTNRGARYQAKVKVRKNSAAYLVRGGFFGVAKDSGSEQIFQRIGRDRLKIRKLTGPSVAQAVTNSTVLNSMSKFVSDELPEQFNREMNFFVKRSLGEL